MDQDQDRDRDQDRDQSSYRPSSAIAATFLGHKNCDWRIHPGMAVRKFYGEQYTCIRFEDRDCTLIETLPVDESNSAVLVSDDLARAMDWGSKFKFGGAWFLKAGTCEEIGHPEISAYYSVGWLEITNTPSVN